MGRRFVIVVIQPEQTAVLTAVQAQCRISGFYPDAVSGNLGSLWVELQGEFGLSMIAESRGGCEDETVRAGMRIHDTGPDRLS